MDSFLKELAREGNVRSACAKSKVGRTCAYKYRDLDRAFALDWDAALKESVDRLEAEAWRRAARGTLEPVFQGGKKVGAVRRYSDVLLIFLLKGNHPAKYRDGAKEAPAPPDPPVQRIEVVRDPAPAPAPEPPKPEG